MGVEILLSKPSLQFVLVLYRQTWPAVASNKLLSAFLHEHPENHLLIIDNSPEMQDVPIVGEANITYQQYPENPGLAPAYNLALAEASKHHHEWLVLLDQDTTLTEDYLAAILTDKQPLDEVVCRVPQMFANQKQISPLLADAYIDRNWHCPPIGVTNRRVMAINSASVWRVNFLEKIGGFSLEFPLDFLDHWLFYQVHVHHKEIEVLPICLEHDLSVLHYQTITMERYQSILAAEARYYTEVEIEKKQRHLQQLQRRTIKQFFSVRNRSIWRATWKSYQNLRRKRK